MTTLRDDTEENAKQVAFALCYVLVKPATPFLIWRHLVLVFAHLMSEFVERKRDQRLINAHCLLLTMHDYSDAMPLLRQRSIDAAIRAKAGGRFTCLSINKPGRVSSGTVQAILYRTAPKTRGQPWSRLASRQESGLDYTRLVSSAVMVGGDAL